MLGVKKYLIMLAALMPCTVVLAKVDRSICEDEEDCVNLETCKCYCSKKCGPRKKEKDDRPVYVKNDPNGKYCYCKEWDRKNYLKRHCDRKEKKQEEESE